MASDWTAAVIAFLSRNLPVDGGPGWDHMFSTAYQVGCEALVALGQADETHRGAVPRQNPQLPDVLPRWDDVCVSVLWLAGQQRKLAYHSRDGVVLATKTTPEWTIVGALPPPAPNIAAAHGLGPAYASPEVMPVLAGLALIADGGWSREAETVLWRGQPPEWQLDVAADPRFSDAVNRASETVPDDIRAEMDRLAVVSEAEVGTAVAESASSYAEARAKYGPKARLSSPFTPAQARMMLEGTRPHWLDDLFFGRWRLDGGWLSRDEAKRALGIFHDRLAIAMRRAVVERLYPDVPFFADNPRPKRDAGWLGREPPAES